ncbi:MAG: RagB/SusD family nutrient uptake outer membrane protein, partial [Bacteroidales bacterium]|nr:RagB/SusD family nutrient uptake outer membrane protein [Bacteroidales bacterium]
MGKSGHLQDLEKWNIHSNMDELAGFWSYCYAVSASATQTSYSCLNLLRDSTKRNLSSAQIKSMQNAVACSKVIRAYCDLYLLQYFCVDYNLTRDHNDKTGVPGNNPYTVGVVLIGNAPLGISDPANTSTLEACYASIEKTLDEAIDYFEQSNTTTYLPAPESRYFPTRCAAHVLQARVFLAQQKYSEALKAIEEAEKFPPSGTSMNLIDNYEALYEGYKSASATSEDIWTINYTSQDNLSANSLQNFFGSYNCAISENITSKLKTNDFRKDLYPSKPGKESRCLKYPNSTGVFNVPVMRVPELYLIKAEVAAANGDNPGMIAALFEVLKARDTSVHELADIESGRYNYGKASTRE